MGKKKPFQLLPGSTKLIGVKLLRREISLGSSYLEVILVGYQGFFFLSPGVRCIEVGCLPAITSGSRNRGLPFEKIIGNDFPYLVWYMNIFNYQL